MSYSVGLKTRNLQYLTMYAREALSHGNSFHLQDTWNMLSIGYFLFDNGNIELVLRNEGLKSVSIASNLFDKKEWLHHSNPHYCREVKVD